MTSLQVFASTHDGAARTLRCSAVSGLESHSAHYAPRQAQLPADGSASSVFWMWTNYGGGLAAPAGEPNFFVGPYLAVTCQLPPATGLNNFILVYREEIGACVPEGHAGLDPC